MGDRRIKPFVMPGEGTASRTGADPAGHAPGTTERVAGSRTGTDGADKSSHLFWPLHELRGRVP
ncbi:MULTISPECIES: hypothetical protein [Streptomyces]|uniref:hypothetical protein n=1 Tax=Streptomyces TaxID=1883 RepID=UPI00200EA09E|nr:hypothetical protein [Streptomyces sp. LRE541]UPZ32963.1 hypothetical protein MUK60_37355 [Streptomyces sp. LRE541]